MKKKNGEEEDAVWTSTAELLPRTKDDAIKTILKYNLAQIDTN